MHKGVVAVAPAVSNHLPGHRERARAGEQIPLINHNLGLVAVFGGIYESKFDIHVGSDLMSCRWVELALRV
jgi:hypothetical protein